MQSRDFRAGETHCAIAITFNVMHRFPDIKTRSMAGCKNPSNVRHKTPIVRANLPQIREKSTTLSRYPL